VSRAGRKARKAKLRLDVKASAFQVKDDVAIVVPGNLKRSELIKRITTSDPDDLMPRPNRTEAHTETNRSADALGGARRQMGNAGIRAASSSTPAKGQRTKLAAKCHRSLRPGAARERWPEPRPSRHQRNSDPPGHADLTGLPPTTAQIDAFLGDRSANAYEKVVDRVLASSRYGERMATEWLDLARYADTHGYQMDRYRPPWPWRDWVIKAFNRNMPYDQFVTWQVAGDLLPNATREQRLATASIVTTCRMKKAASSRRNTA